MTSERRQVQREHDAAFERAMTAAKAYLAGLQNLSLPRPRLAELQRESAAAHDAYLIAARRWHSL